MTDLELMYLLEENGYEASAENLAILKEELAQEANGPELDGEGELNNEATLEKEPTELTSDIDNEDVYGDDEELAEDVGEVVVEGYSDYDLMKMLEENGYSPDLENLRILKESIEILFEGPIPQKPKLRDLIKDPEGYQRALRAYNNYKTNYKNNSEEIEYKQATRAAAKAKTDSINTRANMTTKERVESSPKLKARLQNKLAMRQKEEMNRQRELQRKQKNQLTPEEIEYQNTGFKKEYEGAGIKVKPERAPKQAATPDKKVLTPAPKAKKVEPKPLTKPGDAKAAQAPALTQAPNPKKAESKPVGTANKQAQAPALTQAPNPKKAQPKPVVDNAKQAQAPALTQAPNPKKAQPKPVVDNAKQAQAPAPVANPEPKNMNGRAYNGDRAGYLQRYAERNRSKYEAKGLSGEALEKELERRGRASLSSNNYYRKKNYGDHAVIRECFNIVKVNAFLNGINDYDFILEETLNIFNDIYGLNSTSDSELAELLEECGFEVDNNSIQILRESSIDYSDYELYQLLESNGYTTTNKNLEILKEGLITGDFIIE